MTPLPVFVIALLVGLNALYVAAEFSAVAVQKSDVAPMAKSGNRWAAGLLSVLEDGAALDRYIAACQIGITLSSLTAGAYAQATIAVALAPWLERSFGFDASSAQSTAFTVVLLGLTAIQVVLGELVPKSLALQYKVRVALLTYLPMRWSVSLYRAFVWVLNGSGLLLLKPFGVSPGGHQHVHSPDEIEILLAESRQGGELSPEEYRRLDRGLHLQGRTVGELMTPRERIQAVDESLSPVALLDRILETRYARLPVFRGSLDHVVGVIGIKEAIGAYAMSERIPPVTELIRPIPRVSPALPAHRLVRLLQERRTSKAVVVDELGRTVGLVSIDDVLADLFGNVGDEFEVRPPRRPVGHAKGGR